uniref:CCHC-type domain-containing protein n=1 Tax=Ixodes ricinus TaxID=34613 RepID=A0A6B0V2U0_IXORI
MSSAGAEQASLLGRGERALDLPADYRFILPTLPANDSSKCTAFLHAEIGVRPYRIEDFKEPLRQLGVLSDVTGMGVFQMGHVWIVRLKSTAAKEKLMMSGKFKVKGGWCVPMDPDRREVRLKLHWVPFDVPNDALKRALEEFGVVREIIREKWHIDGFDGVESSTRVARLSLKEGMTLESLPHQLRITGGPVLVVVPGRAPMCLRCKRSGHIRRDCRAPR